MEYQIRSEYYNIFSETLNSSLINPQKGNIAYIKCLEANFIEKLICNNIFKLESYNFFYVTQKENLLNTIRGDKAVEIRESKSKPTLFFIDIKEISSGMDGIFNSGREIKEKELFDKLKKVAKKNKSKGILEIIDISIKKATKINGKNILSPFQELDFIVSSNDFNTLGRTLITLGLWCIKHENGSKFNIDLSLKIIDKIFSLERSTVSPTQKISELAIANITEIQKEKLVQVINLAQNSQQDALNFISNNEDIWINNINPFQKVELIDFAIVSWRKNNGSILRWSGLTDNEDGRPIFFLNEGNGKEKPKLTVKWKTTPPEIEKNSLSYSVTIQANDTILAEKEIVQSSYLEQKCIFTMEDFELEENFNYEANIIIRVNKSDNETIEHETEIFSIQRGDPNLKFESLSGKEYRSLIEVAIQIESEEEFFKCIKNEKSYLNRDKNGYLKFSVKGNQNIDGKLHYPDIIEKIETEWRQSKELGRWIVTIKSDGSISDEPLFIKFKTEIEDKKNSIKKFKELANISKGVMSMIHVSGENETTHVDYLNLWKNIYESNDPSSALLNTLEIKSLSDITIGLIVLPFHPMRVAWNFAYDSLLYHYKFKENIPYKKILEKLSILDSSYFPSYLPGINNTTFIYGENYNFHLVGMVDSTDIEPKQSLALIFKCITNNNEGEIASDKNKISKIISDVLMQYKKQHPDYSNLIINSVKSGDGKVITKAIGLGFFSEDNNDSDEYKNENSFTLNLFSASNKLDKCGSFLSSISTSRRSGSGNIKTEDRWIVEGILKNGIIKIPKLIWTKNSGTIPNKISHITLAFDSFPSEIIPENVNSREGLYENFGLTYSQIREFKFNTNAEWISYIPSNYVGIKHPFLPYMTDRITKFQELIVKLTAMNIDPSYDNLLKKTSINQENLEELKNFHRTSDWVICLDRNIGVELFDSPNVEKLYNLFNGYILSFIPERAELGFVQMMVSTSKFDEINTSINNILSNIKLDINETYKNSHPIINKLKALSGKFVLKLTGLGINSAHEMVAIALCYDFIKFHHSNNLPIFINEGILIPIDDIMEIFKDQDLDEESRADFIYLTCPKKGRLNYNFIEIKYRNSLVTASSNEIISDISRQLKSTKNKWNELYGENNSELERVVNKSKLTKIVKYYNDKAKRHYISDDLYNNINESLDKLNKDTEKIIYDINQDTYEIGLVFCPEYESENFYKISDDPEIYIFGSNDKSIKNNKIFKIDESNPENNEKIIETTIIPDQEEIINLKDLVIEKEKNNSNNNKIINLDNEISINKININLGLDLLNNKDVNWEISIKSNPHLLILGLPGMGKTSSILNLIEQFTKEKILPIIFSYHNDIDIKLKENLKIDFTPIDFNGLGFNPLNLYNQNSSSYLDNASMLRDIFSFIYPDLGDIQLSHIRDSIVSSYKEVNTTESFKEKINIPKFRRFYEILLNNQNDKSIKSVLARISELDDYDFFTDFKENSSPLDFNKPSIVRLHQTQNDVLQRAFSSFVLFNLYQNMFIRGIQEKITHVIIFDEAHKAFKLDLIPKFIKECRKYGISFILASQELRDFNNSVTPNIGNFLSLRINDSDSKLMSKLISGSQDNNKISDSLKNLEKYHGYFYDINSKSKRPTKLLLRNIEVRN